jgi:hypothetical protein
MPLYYAGIGSRQTPSAVLQQMTRIAQRLAQKGYVLRSGGAPGADTAFEFGAGDAKQIFLPWAGFENRTSPYSRPAPNAYEMAALVHPAWRRLSRGARMLQARNSHQIFGPELNDPVRFVVCWTPDGAEHERQTSQVTGGTGQAIRLASRTAVPIFNLKNPSAEQRLWATAG